MKTIKRLQALILAVLVGISCTCTSTTAFAEEIVGDSSEPIEYSDDSGIMLLSVDQTFTFTSYHRGSNRTYSGSYLDFTATITDSSGNATSSVVTINLYNSSGTLVKSVSVSADGNSHKTSNVSITSGGTYYFTYTVSSGSTTTLKIRMVISDHS